MQLNRNLHLCITGMRVALGLIFLWFGLLKLFGASPVQKFVASTTPLLGSGMGWILLGVFEVILGVGLIFKIAPKILSIALILHMVGTFSTFFTAPTLMFRGYPWLLTFEGEFVVKNLVLAVGALIVLFAAKNHKEEDPV